MTEPDTIRQWMNDPIPVDDILRSDMSVDGSGTVTATVDNVVYVFEDTTAHCESEDAQFSHFWAFDAAHDIYCEERELTAVGRIPHGEDKYYEWEAHWRLDEIRVKVRLP